MAHVRKGRLAKAQRQERAAGRAKATAQHLKHIERNNPEERLLDSIFGVHEECIECGNSKLIGADCQTPHCKTLRHEESVFYDENTEDSITI